MNAQDSDRGLSSRDRELLSHVDRLLEGNLPPSRPDSTEGFSARLLAARPRASARFQTELEERVMEVVGARTKRRTLGARLRGRRRTAAAAAILLVAVLASLTASPAVRSWAGGNVDELMQQLGLQNAPVSLDKPAGTGEQDNLTSAQVQSLL